jgi:HlyD family secretion protein
VRKVTVQEGEQVTAGQVLVQLDDGVERAALQAAEADLAAERANLTRTLRGLRVEDKDAVSAEAQAARARAALSASVLARTEVLAQSGAVTQDELERARRQAQADEATYKAVEARLRAAEAGSRSEDVAFAKARVLATEARVAQARAALERLSIRAPLAGEVLQVKVREGELYSFQGSEPLLILGDTRRLRVRMDVDERDIARVKQGASAYVTADAFGTRRFTGRVVELGRRFGRKNVRTDDPVEKNDTKILEVVIELDSNALLVPGQRVTSFVATAE